MTGTSNSDKAALGDRVFLDLDGDGFQDGNEPGVAHVTVRLQTPKGETIRNVVTDDNGFFLFDNLDPGDYKFTVVEPDGFDGFTIQNARGVDDSADSDVNPNTGMSPIIHLSPGEDNRTVDAGLKPKPEPEPEPEPEPATLGNFVFNDLDGDGFQDPNEPGVEDVLVRLQTPDGTEVSTTTTNNNGKYLFDNLDPGRYKITVDKPDGFEFTQQFATFNGSRQPAIDSNINPVNGMSNVINLNPGAKNLTVDAGLIAETEPEPEPEPARLGDFVFNDLDEDGIQDEGEPGIEGATVILQNPAGDTLEETVTNADGFYSFDDLTPGRYKVTFVQPDGFNAVSPFLVGGDRSIDSDANPNNGLMSRVVNLAPGAVNKTIDAGFFNDTPDVNPGIDLEKLVRVEPVGFPPGNFGLDVGDDYGKPQALVFQYTGGAATTQTAQDSDTEASGATMFDDVVTVSAADKKGRSIFSQEVELGERVTISASDFGKGKFDSESHFSIHIVGTFSV